MKYKFSKKESARQRIWRLKRQYIDLDQKYEGFESNIYPPCLCRFCQHLWSTWSRQDYDGDWGCDKNCKKFDNEDGQVDHCGRFKANKNWEAQAEVYLNKVYYEILDKMLPYANDIKSARACIESYRTEINRLIAETERIKSQQKLEYDHHLAKLEKLIPMY
jgi:hypothetical protein